MTPNERMRAAVKTVQTMEVFPPFSGPAPDSAIAKVEKKLGVPITGSYREFIRLLGSQNDFGFCGVNMEYKGAGTEWGTELMRRDYGLPKHYLVVWVDEGMQEAWIMDCSDPQPDGEFPVYWVIMDDWENFRMGAVDSFVEAFEKNYGLKSGGKVVVKKKTAAERKEEKRQAQAVAKTRALLAAARPKRGADKRPPLVRRMDSAIAALLDSGCAPPLSGPVSDQLIDRVAKKLGLPITGSYRRFIQLAGNLKGDFRGIDAKAPEADLLRVTRLMRRKHGLPDHYLVVLYDEDKEIYGDESMRQAFLMDCSQLRADGEFQTYRTFVDDWQDMTEDAPSFVDMFADFYAPIELHDKAAVEKTHRPASAKALKKSSGRTKGKKGGKKSRSAKVAGTKKSVQRKTKANRKKAKTVTRSRKAAKKTVR